MLLLNLRRTLQNAQKRATARGTRFELGEADIFALWDAQAGRCALSGRPLLISAERGMQDAPSLDQIVAGGGYRAGNVQLVTTQCNLAKSTLSHDEFVHLCEQVYYYNLSPPTNAATSAPSAATAQQRCRTSHGAGSTMATTTLTSASENSLSSSSSVAALATASVVVRSPPAPAQGALTTRTRACAASPPPQ